MMSEAMTLKEYHFTDKQIDYLLRLARSEAFRMRHCAPEGSSENIAFADELANQIEDQIVNHPTND
jgi:hypothetical protein